MEDRIFYSLSIEDIQTVAQEVLERDLTDKEIEKVIPVIEEKMCWFDAIQDSIIESFHVENKQLLSK